jgi:uncharacterized protein with HEPN domain
VKDDRVYLQHIRDALDDIANYANAGQEAFLAERMRQDATLRKLQVIGQAVKNLSDRSKSRQPHIPWKQIAGLRDKVIHDYFGVNLEIVWAVVEKDLPQLRRAVEALLSEADGGRRIVVGRLRRSSLSRTRMGGAGVTPSYPHQLQGAARRWAADHACVKTGAPMRGLNV